uniref:Uncharacterized protein n=1 Tax=Tetraselmis chuii TaxID=63592 RepID=A0A7S1X5Z3_9CHLO|mmetsp:Transcript_32606/g.58382  ORF Transcript_32606/g.58382 Transcript_32606/m.58382 type:complete len:226 (+) Transcript_32606:2-679(+)
MQICRKTTVYGFGSDQPNPAYRDEYPGKRLPFVPYHYFTGHQSRKEGMPVHSWPTEEKLLTALHFAGHLTYCRPELRERGSEGRRHNRNCGLQTRRASGSPGSVSYRGRGDRSKSMKKRKNVEATGVKNISIMSSRSGGSGGEKDNSGAAPVKGVERASENKSRQVGEQWQEAIKDSPPSSSSTAFRPRSKGPGHRGRRSGESKLRQSHGDEAHLSRQDSGTDVL